MEYDKATFEDVVQRFGEAWFVLDSDREYQVHGTEGYEITNIGGQLFARVEGMQGDEYVVAEFPLDAIEHHFTHREI